MSHDRHKAALRRGTPALATLIALATLGALGPPIHSVRADTDRAPENRGLRAVRFQAQFESIRGNPIAPDRLPRKPAIDMTMWSGMLSGFGRGHQVELSSDHSGAEPMNIEANRWVPRAFARAAPLGKPLPAGLVLSPADTRVGTVSAIAYASRVGTIDPRRIGKLQRNLLRVNRLPATLVFFDRPCSLVGTWVENALQAQVEIHIPGTGFYWLTWVEDAPGRFHMNATTTPEDAELVFVIS